VIIPFVSGMIDNEFVGVLLRSQFKCKTCDFFPDEDDDEAMDEDEQEVLEQMIKVC